MNYSPVDRVPNHEVGVWVQTKQRWRAEGLPADFPAQWAVNNAQFPRGVDVVLCAGDRLAALPRTTRISEA